MLPELSKFLEYEANQIDPMQVIPAWRDPFPKLGLQGKDIGDGLPLCSDLPDRHFLRSGATYILLGSIPSSKYHNELSEWSQDINVVRTKLDSEKSLLYGKLCNSQNGKCQYAPKVVLDTNLNCVGIECEIQAPRLVEVEPGVYYEYVRVPCTQQAFFSDGQVLKEKLYYSCGDPRQQTGTFRMHFGASPFP